MTAQFLLISDIHFNPFYDGSLFGDLAGHGAESWADILGRGTPAVISPYHHDSNYFLLRSALADAAARLPDPEFVLYPGDFMGHKWQKLYDSLAPTPSAHDQEAYRSFTTKSIEFLASEFRRAFPDAPILPTLGNDDSYCGDYLIQPGGPFLAMFGDTWAPLLGPGVNRDAFRATFDAGGYYTLPLPGLPGHRLVVLNTVFFSFKYDNACGEAHETHSLDQLEWLGDTLAGAAHNGEQVWLLMHIPPGINDFNTAANEKQHQPAVIFWQSALQARFLQLCHTYEDTIQTAFVGHTHMDDYRVVRFDRRPTLLFKIAPAISPIFGNNPGYQIWDYDAATGALHDFHTYHTAHPGAPQDQAAWGLGYGFRDAYGLDGVDAESVARLAAMAAADEAVLDRYVSHYSVGAVPTVPAATAADYVCALTNVSKAAYQACYDARLGAAQAS